MECPQCKNQMEVKWEVYSVHNESGKRYRRVTYWCQKDDVWVSVEIPTEPQLA